MAAEGTLMKAEGVGVALGIRGYPSIHHAYSAQFFAKKASELQIQYLPKPVQERPHGDLMAYVQGSIMASGALLEASITELYNDVLDKVPNSHYRPISPAVESVLRSSWSKQFDLRPTLRKYQETLEFWALTRMEKTNPIYRDAADLMELRNRIVHPRSETHVIHSTAASVPLSKPEIAKRLEGRIPPHPWHEDSPGDAYRAIFSADCAAWGIHASRTFLDHFFELIGTGAAYRSASAPV